MEDITKAYRGLDKLNSNFRKKVEKFLEEVEKTGEKIFVTETWRSEERQKYLIKTGASKVKRSNHQDGLAVDIAFHGGELYPKDINRWKKIAKIANKYGIDWGFDLWKWDQTHFQDNGENLEIKTDKITELEEEIRQKDEEIRILKTKINESKEIFDYYEYNKNYFLKSKKI